MYSIALYDKRHGYSVEVKHHRPKESGIPFVFDVLENGELQALSLPIALEGRIGDIGLERSLKQPVEKEGFGIKSPEERKQAADILVGWAEKIINEGKFTPPPISVSTEIEL